MDKIRQPGLFRVISKYSIKNRNLEVQTGKFGTEFKLSFQKILLIILSTLLLCLLCFSSKTSK